MLDLRLYLDWAATAIRSTRYCVASPQRYLNESVRELDQETSRNAGPFFSFILLIPENKLRNGHGAVSVIRKYMLNYNLRFSPYIFA